MLRVGLTGGIGTGKSTVAGMFAQLGACIIDADLAAREVVVPGSQALAEIVDSFGAQVLSPGGQLDRARLAQLAFADRQKLDRLNAITHPKVREWMLARAREAESGGARIVILDIPLLYENGLEASVDTVVVVYASEATQLRRLEAKGYLPEQAQARLRAQMPISQKVGRASFVIDNGGGLDSTAEQVKAIWDRLLQQSAGPADSL